MSKLEVSQKFLDSVQYETASILQYESVFGKDFVSPGGREVAVELITQLDLPADSRVLDVGCGIGGSAFVMAREFDLQVDGIDLSKNMLALANNRLIEQGLTERVKLDWQDCLKLDRAETYDAVYSRDVFLHIQDKPQLFKVLNQSLLSGGQLLFTDYCCGPKPWEADFSDYVEQRGYCLHTLEDYAGLISAAGFEEVAFRNLTDRFVAILESDMLTIAKMADSEDREKLATSWRQKIERAKGGDHRWGLFTARKAG